ncbi:MAG: transposase [Chloroflexota bacterium]
MSKPEFLTASYVIRQSDPRWQELDRMSLLAKNVFNSATYLIRQAFFTDCERGIEHDKRQRTWVRMLNFIHLKETLRRDYASDYSAMPKRVTETCIQAVISMWRGYDAAWFDWQQSPHKYVGEPSIPRYKKSGDVGRAQVLWNQEAISKRLYDKQGLIGLSGCEFAFLPGKHIYEQIRRIENLSPDLDFNLRERMVGVSVLPRADHYLLTVTYRVSPIPYEQLDPSQVMGIDLGVNNLMAITSNKAGFKPILVNGRPLKSLNQYFNKRRAKLQSKLPEKQYSSQRLRQLHQKRNRQIKDYLHRASKLVIQQALQAGIGTIVIGQNKNWKQHIKLGKRNNQSFLSIPHSQLIEMISYKAHLVGIGVICQEESYTSKCSFLDGEPIQKHEVYAGQRVKRGLFKARTGKLINADVNASYNIIKKAFPNAFADGIADVLAVHPTLITA